MAKKVVKEVKMQIEGGKANPAPPVGPALGQAGVNISQFCSQFNERTKDQMGYIVPVVISVYDDRSFSFITKTPPASDLIKSSWHYKRSWKSFNRKGWFHYRRAIKRDCDDENARFKRL